MRQPIFLQGVLAAMLIVSSVGLVYVQHQHRALYVELQSLERERDSLEVEWGKLQLEQSTWATHERIESLARKRLDFHIPPTGDVVLVTR